MKPKTVEICTMGIFRGNFPGNKALVQFLKSKFDDKQNPSYLIKEIPEESLEIERTRRRLKIFKTIDGSLIFQAMRFKANQSSFKASPYVYVHHAKMTLVVVRTSRHIVWKSTCYKKISSIQVMSYKWTLMPLKISF